MRIHATSKSHLFLLEFIIIVLLFALAAVVAVSFFVKAHNASKGSTDLTCAMVLAESTSEELRSGASVPASANYDSNGVLRQDGDYLVGVKSNAEKDLTYINIHVSKDGNHVYTLNTAVYKLTGEVIP